LPAGGLLVVACGALDATDPGVIGRMAGRYRPAVLARFGSRKGGTSAGADPQVPGAVVTVEAATAAEFCGRWRERSPMA
jgi:hypothetical protein